MTTHKFGAMLDFCVYVCVFAHFQYVLLPLEAFLFSVPSVSIIKLVPGGFTVLIFICSSVCLFGKPW